MQNRAQYVAYASDAKRVSRALCCCVKPPLPRRPVKRVINAVQRGNGRQTAVTPIPTLVHVDICPFQDVILIEGFGMHVLANPDDPTIAPGDAFTVKVFALADSAVDGKNDIGDAVGASLGLAKGTAPHPPFTHSFVRLDTPVFVDSYVRAGLLLQLSPGLMNIYEHFGKPVNVAMDNGSAIMRAIGMRTNKGVGLFGEPPGQRQSTMSIHYRVRSKSGDVEKAVQTITVLGAADKVALKAEPEDKALNDHQTTTIVSSVKGGLDEDDPFLLLTNLITNPTETDNDLAAHYTTDANLISTGADDLVSDASDVGSDVASVASDVGSDLSDAVTSVSNFFSGL